VESSTRAIPETLRPICELEINKIPIDEHASKPELPPVPIPEPETDVASATVDFQIVRFPILEALA
jgi:hypothetical protein